MTFSEGRTTIILGAGSSKEAGLPVGRELKSQIAQLLDIRYENGYTRISGSREIDTAFRILVEQAGQRDINPYLQACWRIRDAMPQAISIDNYLDAHVDDSLTVTAGKLAIAQAILNAEKRSSFFIDRLSDMRTIDFSRVEDTWFNKFVQLLTENCRRDAISESLSNVSIVTFNYDRCFEHFVYYAIQNYYRMNEQEAAEAMSHFNIYHPYGMVGSLPWQRQDTPIEFGAEPHPRHLIDISAQIRTFTEGTDPKSSNIDLIRSCVAECDRLIFLGFAFHPMNMNLIGSQQDSHAPKASYGTALGLSNPDCAILEREIRHLVGTEIETVHLRNDLSCSKLLDEYRRSLTSS